MTNWYVCFWSIYDQDVSFAQGEKNLSFKLNKYYAYCRDFMNRTRFVYMIILVDIYSIVCGFIIFLVFYCCEGAMNADGQVFGMYTYGVFSVVCAVIIHHIQVFINTRNFTCWLTFWIFFSIIMLPLVLKLSDGLKNSYVRKATYSIIIPSPLILAMFVLTITMCAMPLYINKKVR